MGQCQCRETASAVMDNDERVQIQKNVESTGRSDSKVTVEIDTPAKQNDPGTATTNEREEHVANGAGVHSPSEATVPETPDTVLSPASSTSEIITPRVEVVQETPRRSNSRRPKAACSDNVEEEEEDFDGIPVFEPTSLLQLEELDAVIPEEEDPCAPTDEEEDYETNVAPIKNTAADDTEPGRLIPGSERAMQQLSPPRSLSAIHSRDPNSAILHHPPLVTPPPGEADMLSETRRSSLDSHTMAEFRKLKLQVKLAAHQRKKSKRQSKKQDRVQDVREYRELWRRFMELEEVVKQTRKSPSPRKPACLTPRKKRRKRERLFDLKSPVTWFFDFDQLIEEEEEGWGGAAGDCNADDEDDVSLGSQGSLSLLSATSMESQKRYYAEKQRLREQKDAAENVGEKLSIRTTLDAMEIMLNNKPTTPSKVESDDDDDDSSIGGGDKSMSRSMRKRMRKLLCTPTSIKFNQNSKTALHYQDQSRAGISPFEDLSDIESDVDENKKSPRKPVPTSFRDRLMASKTERTSHDSEKKRSLLNRIQCTSHADPEDGYDNHNDYRVSRRRRQYYNPAELSDVAAISPGKYNDTASHGSSWSERYLALDLPTVEATAGSQGNSPRWRTFESSSSKGIKDNVLENNAAKCLENVYAALEQEETEANPDSSPTIESPTKPSPPVVQDDKLPTPETTSNKGPQATPDSFSPKISSTKKLYPKPKSSKSKPLPPNEKSTKPDYSVYTMSTEQFLCMSSTPLDQLSLDGSLSSNADSEAKSAQQEASEKSEDNSISDVVLHGVANLLSQFRGEEETDEVDVDITAESIEVLSEISFVPEDEEEGRGTGTELSTSFPSLY